MRILVTGASRGIGRHIVRALAEPGRTIHLHARTVEALKETGEACAAKGAEVVLHGAELTIEGATALAEEVGDLDMIVNNAGVSGTELRPPWEISTAEFVDTMTTNVYAPFILNSSAAKSMLGRGGYIVDLSSGAAVTDRGDSADYWVSKTALLRLGGSFHEAGIQHGIKVFEVAPGVVQTDMTNAMSMHNDRTEWTDPAEVSGIISAISHGELDALAGTQLRAGVDKLPDLLERAQRGITNAERKLRLTGWND
ncbi:MAG: SDR family oxidoreductase [Flaviflexus sp.]|uniref:SDR family NAD(P)-dependent oxidoreductase n=1 Tax=Flaviflexus sp. TaxID=1969482 RepID=UPI00352F9AB7